MTAVQQIVLHVTNHQSCEKNKHFIQVFMSSREGDEEQVESDVVVVLMEIVVHILTDNKSNNMMWM